MLIDWNDNKAKISKFFSVGEVTQFDNRRVPIKGSLVEKEVLRLAKELDLIREKWGSAIRVTSWYRPKDINKSVGGVENSQHILGSAADLTVEEKYWFSFDQFLDKEWGDKAIGYGLSLNKGFTHVDLRPGRIRFYY